jgi:hypothetical protein
LKTLKQRHHNCSMPCGGLIVVVVVSEREI